MGHVEKDLSLLILLITLAAVHWRYCNASSQKNEDEEVSTADEEDWHGNSSSPGSTHSLLERRKRSKVRHRSRDAYQDETVETTTPVPEKLTEVEIIHRILFKNEYDWRVRPVGLNTSYGDTGGPVKVTVNIYLRSISKIDDVNMEYSAQFTFRETWIDRRLAYERMKNATYTVPSFIVLALSDDKQQIWMPDTFFQNEKEARKHLIDKPNVLIRIYPHGEILYSVRLSMVLSCPMSLEYYPLDEQKCLIELASYAYTTDDIVYEWKNDTPVQQKDGLGKSLPSFELQAVKTGYCTSTTNTGQYSCLRTELILRREFSYYLLQLYIPSFMLVIVSWVSFWLDKDSVPARVTLGVTTLLTMTTQSSGINAKLPPVSYTKAIDVWIGVCLAFIFGALLEFALVNYAARKDIMRNVSGAMRRGRRPGISTGAGPPPVDPSLESLTMSNEGAGMVPGGPPPPPPTDEQCNYNTFMMNPLLKTPSPMMLRHPQDILPHPARNTYNTISRQHPHQQYQQFQNSPMHSMSLMPAQQQPGSNGRIPSSQLHNHQSHPQHPGTGAASSQRQSRHQQRSCMDLWLSKYKERSKRIDVVSRLVFPVGFFIFNCVYWTVYML